MRARFRAISFGQMSTRKDSFDRAVGNNTVCKSCAQSDRKLAMDTIEKMKQPKTIEHKKKISYGVQKWWDDKRESEWLS